MHTLLLEYCLLGTQTLMSQDLRQRVRRFKDNHYESVFGAILPPYPS